MDQTQPGSSARCEMVSHWVGMAGVALGRAHQQGFHLSDGGALDFRGGRERSIGGSASPLANSNQRGTRGLTNLAA